MDIHRFSFNRALKTRMAHAVMAHEGLVPVKRLYDTGEVYLVMQGEEARVFKVGFSGDERDKKHILPEARALQLLADNETLQTPTLHGMESDEVGGYHALSIVKSYIPGITMDLSERPVAVTAYDALETAIEEAHAHGVANLDIGACNILERRDGTLQFFEYSGVRFRDPQPGLTPTARLWTGKKEFTRYERKDWMDFESTKQRLSEQGKLH